MIRRSAIVLCTGICIAIVIQSCNNELDVNGQFVEKTVVWGLLEINKDTNFIRINKAFLDENSSAYYLATDPSNLNFEQNDLEVYLEEWLDGLYQKRIEVQYVNGDTIGLPKEDGIFANSPNILYRIATPLDTFATYKLFIVNLMTGDTIKSQTNLVQPFYVYYPTKSGAFMNYTDTTKITYSCHTAVNGKVYELWMDFYYWEYDGDPGDSSLKKISWQIFSNKFSDNIEGMGNVTYSMYRNSFFTFLASAINSDNEIKRSVSHLEFRWYAGGIELYDQYLNVVANLGINQEYISPEFTNIEGGLGLFSSRLQMTETPVYLTNETIDSISCGPVTNGLNFNSSYTNPYYPNCKP